MHPTEDAAGTYARAMTESNPDPVAPTDEPATEALEETEPPPPEPELVAVYCGRPGPHDPPDGLVGYYPVDEQPDPAVVRCASPYCDPEAQAIARDNRAVLTERARAAYADNRALIANAQVDAYLAAANPSTAATVSAVKLLLREARAAARQRNGIMRLLLGDLEGTD